MPPFNRSMGIKRRVKARHENRSIFVVSEDDASPQQVECSASSIFVKPSFSLLFFKMVRSTLSNQHVRHVVKISKKEKKFLQQSRLFKLRFRLNKIKDRSDKIAHAVQFVKMVLNFIREKVNKK